MEQTDLYKQKLVRGKRTYFFDIKKTEKEDFYIKLTEGKKSNRKILKTSETTNNKEFQNKTRFNNRTLVG